MYDLNLMSSSITNGVQVFFLLHFQDFCVRFDGFHDFRMVPQRAPPLPRCQFQPPKPKDLLQKISQVLKLFSAISFHLQGWQSLTCLACFLSPPVFVEQLINHPKKAEHVQQQRFFWSWSHKGLKWQALATSDCVKRESC